MAVTDIIRERKSVRSYSGVPLDVEHIADIKEYVSGLPQPLGGRARVETVSRDVGSGGVKLGTYGMISGASDFLVLIYEDGPMAAENAGYLFERVILYCTEKGLGTCWLGGTFKKSGFTAHVEVVDNELLRIVSPVGYPASGTGFRDRIIRAGVGSDRRKPFGELFFDRVSGKPLERGGPYDTPLEMVRLAPSANNSQPWRIMVDETGAHFCFLQKSRLTDIDMGIAMSHFELACREAGIAGKYEIVTDVTVPAGMNYLASWLPE